VHVPFCVSRCAYCDFASEVVSPERVRLYLDALAREVDRSPFKGAAPETVYVGGGTPTSMADGELAELVAILARGFDLSRAIEFTVEANPGTVDEKRMALLRGFGANRVSLGVQSFEDERLRLLGRAHSSREAEEAFAAARAAGFDNVSLDLIFAVPGQELDDVASDVARAVGLGPEHVSLYGLTYEAGTRMRRMLDAGEVTSVDEESERAMYLSLIDSLERSGYPQYEISNFARPGLESRHNLACWLGEEYIGLGPSAASYTGGERRKNVRGLTEYARRLARGVEPVEERERLPPERASRERACLALRTRRGIDPTDFERRTGFDLDALLGEAGTRLFAGGWLEMLEGRVRLSREALPVADAVLSEIV
ncbi:MAG: radical SAM family heme chaperone HemW, partial [Planctomycetota bacterium]|jgi:oxygen-independent coproporphyrinogen-3 oxidase